MPAAPDSRAPNSYIICATPRTGSTLLCDLLTATGAAGAPDSFFMRDVDPAWAAEWKLPVRGGMGDAEYAAAYLAAATAAGRGQTPIFGLRLMHRHLDDLMAMIAQAHPGLRSDSARIGAAFGETLYVHLTRADKLAQAVSLVKAEQTGLWHVAPDGTEVERLSPPQEPEYDFARIARKLAELDREDAAWPIWFDAQRIAPLRIAYEDLSADPATSVGRVCTALDVPIPEPAALAPGVARLADGVSLDWMARYRRDAAAASA